MWTFENSKIEEIIIRVKATCQFDVSRNRLYSQIAYEVLQNLKSCTNQKHRY